MPFDPLSTLPVDAPSARVFLNGLLFCGVDPDSGKFCRIGVHRSSPDHYLSVEVRVKRQGFPDFIIMRHMGPLSFLDGDEGNPGLLIKVNPPTNAGVRKLIPLTGNLDRKPGSTSDAQDYRWAIDLEGPDFHVHPLTIDRNCTEPGILLTDGILYTALKSDEDTVIKKIRGGSSVEFYPIAALLGVNIYLATGHDLFLQWVKDGIGQELILHRPADPSKTSYEIYIDNSPPFVNDFKHHELKEYYKAIQNVPTNEQFDLEMSRPVEPHRRSRLMTFVTEGDNLGTPTIPCMPITHGG